ncbi:hypothetical protein GCM10008932_01360 [Alkalibacterium iburiense]|uniref:Uncharacterized protein n=1 Tax=Alkalibacterium iburiense TaxID=290589 RepID=A0ABP3GTM6_9LACT
MKSPHVFFVFEHTPHTNPTEDFVNEGIDWVKEMIENNDVNKQVSK